MKNLFKKSVVLFSLLAFLFASNFTYFAAPAKAQEWYDPTFAEFFQKVNDPDNPEEIFGERYTSAQVTWVVFGWFSFVFKSIPLGKEIVFCATTSGAAFLGILDATMDCAVGLVTADSSINNPGAALADNRAPQEWYKIFTERHVSTIAYFRYVGERLHIVPEAKAQGFGFGAASPVLEVWRQVRNVAYIFLIIVMVAMAFMIMFRMKLSSQTVISVQSALPKIVIALILITFSYAIAGFLIDLMYVVIGLIAAIIYQSGLSTLEWGELYSQLTNAKSVFDFVWAYLATYFVALLSAVNNSGLSADGRLLTSVVGMLFMVILLLALIYVSVKLLWVLIKTFITVLLLIIVGPIQILLGTVGYGGFGKWVQSLISNLAVYPVVGIMFFLTFLFLRAAMGDVALDLLNEWFARIPGGWNQIPFGIDYNTFQTGAGQAPWSPPMTIGAGESIELLWLAASFGIYMLIPKAADIIKGFISGRPFAGYGTAIAAPISAAAGVAYRPIRGPVEAVKEARQKQRVASALEAQGLIGPFVNALRRSKRKLD